MDWCPTDPDPRNPYAKKSPKITGVKNKTVQLGDEVDLEEGVNAYDTAGNNITSKLQVSGKVNTKKIGTYKVTYSVVDAIKRCEEDR